MVCVAGLQGEKNIAARLQLVKNHMESEDYWQNFVDTRD